MRCLVTGAYGFIAANIVRALESEGAEVIGAGRDLRLGARLIPDIKWIKCDFNRDLEPETWAPRVRDINVVINCVGILQSTAWDSAQRIHDKATVALFRACQNEGVGRLIHVSAMSAEEDISTGYAETKLRAEHALEDMDINWLIIKPSLVIGRGSYGGTSVIRGLAGLPFAAVTPETGEQIFQPIIMADLARGIARLAKIDVPTRETLYAAGPEAMTIQDIVLAHRRWLGFPASKMLHIPRVLLKPVLWIGDFAGWLGNPSAVRSTSLDQMQYDEIVDPGPFAHAAGIALTPLADALKQKPSTLQDRLHARLFFFGPALRIVLSVFWVLTGLISLSPSGYSTAVAFLTQTGLPEFASKVLVGLGGIADIALGVLFMFASLVRWVGTAQIALSLLYLLMLTVLAPELWVDPLGPLLKVLPLILATAIVMALAEKR